MKGCVLIPIYNESKTIGQLVRSIKEKGLDALVVDDGSTDGSGDASISAGAILAKKHDAKLGKGVSLRDGFKGVLDKGYDYVLTLDGDGQHDPREIDKFLAKLDQSKADIIQGNRMSDVSSMPFIRKLTNRFMSFMISKMIGQRVEDTQCGYRLLRRSALERLDLKTEKFEIDSEILIDAKRRNLTIESVPIRTIYDNEESQIRPFRDTLRFMIFLLRRWTKHN